jgi:hypothetical protein
VFTYSLRSHVTTCKPITTYCFGSIENYFWVSSFLGIHKFHFQRTSASYGFYTWDGINLNVNFSILQTLQSLDFWHILCLNFWYIYHMGLQQLSPCTTMSFNGSWRTCSISSTILLPRVSREIATESSEWAYIPTSPPSQFLEPPCSPWLLSYSNKTMCLIRNKRTFSFIWIANKKAPQINLLFHLDGQLNGSPRSYHLLWIIEYL